MAAGGQGAPLVPLVDYLLLRDTKQGTVALNIGGIANVTVIPAGARPDDVYGFDTGPGNMIIDELVRTFTHGRRQYDSEGRMAARGKVLDNPLAQMLRSPFSVSSLPKVRAANSSARNLCNDFSEPASRSAPGRSASNGNRADGKDDC